MFPKGGLLINKNKSNFMSNPLEMLEIVDENDNVIGLETKGKIHQDELLHRVIHIWFITPKGEIIFQHRAKSKDLLPDKLDATVGGHVEMGATYEETAVKECKEETGIDIDPSNLVFLSKKITAAYNEKWGKFHRNMNTQYAYFYEGNISDLKTEINDGEGFEVWKIDDLPNLSEDDKLKFIPEILTENMFELFNIAKEKLLK